MKSIDLLNMLNDYSFSGETNKIIEVLNELFDSGKYKAHLNLVFNAISLTQMYGFVSYLNDDERSAFLSYDKLRSESYSGKTIEYYNSGQLSLLLELQKFEKVFFSAPTSFGKTSLLIEFIVHNYKQLSNLLIIVPTNSLLEELYIKIIEINKKYEMYYHVSTQPYYKNGLRNFLLVTPERFLLLYESCDISLFNTIIMDETYKIADSKNAQISDFIETRSLRFRKVADIIGQTPNRVIFLSPFTYELTDTMQRFLSRHSIKKIDRTIEYVNKEIYKIDDAASFREHFKIRVVGYSKSASRADKTNLILRVLQDQKNIVYVSQYNNAYDIIDKLTWTKKVNVTERYLKFISHLEETYTAVDSYEWKIISALKKGVGIYIAPLPRYIKREIINLYEENVLGTLIVTTSFTEGVNTNACNLIFTSLVNGPTTNRLSDIDILNVSGRAGRFAQQSIGKIYCITQEVYEKVQQLQTDAQVKLENYNYCTQPHKRIDYEIDMIADEYLSTAEKEEKRITVEEMSLYGLTYEDLRLSLNVSTKWKLSLYKYFLNHQEKLEPAYEKAYNLLNSQPNTRLDSLYFIFNLLQDSFSESKIEGFMCEPYEIKPFDNKGGFIWGRLYGIYCSGKISKIISNNIKFITDKYNDIINEKNLHNITKKSNLQSFFEEENLGWVLRYYKSDLTLNYDAFYSETFKFISSIIQYKIPFYTSFFVSILKLYIQKNQQTFQYDLSCLDVKKIALLFEEGSVCDDYSTMIDYGISNDIVMELQENQISIEQLKTGEYNKSLFDEYEQLMINDFLNILY